MKNRDNINGVRGRVPCGAWGGAPGFLLEFSLDVSMVVDVGKE
jgi:hypothetical protein